MASSPRSLQDELDELRNVDVDAWLRVVSAEAAATRNYERSLSWRVTRPLRMVGMFQRSIRDVGVVATGDRLAAYVVRKVRRS